MGRPVPGEVAGREPALVAALEADGGDEAHPPHADDPDFIVHRSISNKLVTDNFTFLDLKAYGEHYWPDDAEHAYERTGQLGDPGFKSFDIVTARSDDGDDLRIRLHPKSPAKDTAVTMPDELSAKYTLATGTPPADRGCYPNTGAPLEVGVDGRMVYPWIHPRPRPDTHFDDFPAEVGDNV